MLDGQDQGDELGGGPSIDVLLGAGGDDVLLGGDGDDNLDGDTGDDRLLAGPGNDRANGAEGADRIEGFTGNDQLQGGDDRDNLLGQGGADRLNGGPALDTCDGGGQDADDLVNSERGDDEPPPPPPPPATVAVRLGTGCRPSPVQAVVAVDGSVVFRNAQRTPVQLRFDEGAETTIPGGARVRPVQGSRHVRLPVPAGDRARPHHRALSLAGAGAGTR